MFKFKLQKLLELRNREKNIKARDYADALLKQNQTQAAIVNNTETLKNNAQRVDEALETMQDVSMLQVLSEYRRWVGDENATLANKLHDQQAVTDSKWQALLESRKKARMMEILRDKSKTRYKERQVKQEAKEMDEVAQHMEYSKLRHGA